MKNSKLRILSFIFLMATAFGDVNAQVIAEGYYEGSYIKYGKHLIQASLNEDSINNVSYMNKVGSFLYAINAEIDTIYALNRIWHSSGIYVMTIIKLLNDTMDALDYIPVIQNGGFFRYVQPCLVPEELGGFPHPNDQLFPDQTYLYQERGPLDPNHDIDADKAWTITLGSTVNSRIYIVDSGIRCLAPSYNQIDHEDLSSGFISLGTNFTTDTHLNDGTGHGTRIAGFVGATQNNSVGISGLAPHSRIIIDKVKSIGGTSFVSYFTSSLTGVVNFKRQNPNIGVVVSISTIWLMEDTQFRSALDSARRYNVTVVCGSGNYPTVPDHLVAYPARYANTFNNVISVGAVDNEDEFASYSCYGRPGTQEVTVCAPGGLAGLGSGLTTTSNTSNNAYTSDYSGTSFSAPLTAAAVGLMLSVKNNLTPEQIKNKLINSVEKVEGMNGANYTVEYGYGRLNTFNCVAKALDSITGGISISNWQLNYNLRMEDNINIAPQCTITILPGSVVVLDNNANLSFGQFAKIIVRGGATFIQRRGSTITDRAEILLDPGSHYYIEDGADLNIAGQGTGGPNDNGCLAIWGGTLHIEDNADILMSEGGFMTIRNGGKIVLGKNSNLTFGGKSFLELYRGSTIEFDEDAGIQFRDTSYLYARTNDTSRIRLQGVSLATLWKGIEFEKTITADTVNLIRDCVFSEAKTAITIRNDQSGTFVNRKIQNCTFNIPTGGDHKGIYGENNYSILVEGNRFNMPVPPPVDAPFYTGVYLKNVTPSSPPETAGEEGASATPYSLNIVNNTFRNGSSGIVLANYTSNLLPYYIKGNRFDSLDAHAATVNIIGMKITGTIKDNVLSSSQSPIGIHLINSSPNLLNNIIVARDVSLHLVGSSYANLAPNIYNNQAYWSAGRNTLSSYLYDNIQLAYMGNAYTDYGRNKFTVSNDSAYHIYGWLDTNVLRYHSRDNCWYTSGAAKIYLRHPGATMPVLSTIYNRGIDCNSSPAPITWEVDNLGNGIFDSVLVSEDVSDSLPTEEEILIAQCEHYLNEMQMFGEAMISLKYYIDDYPEGEYTNDALMNLYTAYLYLDTSANQNNRNILFGNLINYCEDKVTSNLYDTQFEYLAGDVIAMCNFELDNYDDAMNWYEFIALYYPDPDIRLSASWNYAEIEALIGSGTGGGEVELGIKNYELGIKCKDENAELNRLSEAISDDPVMRKLKRQFENESGSKSGKTADSKLADIHSDDVVANTETAKSEIIKLKYDKARRNIFGSKGLSKQQMEADRMKDIVLIAKGERRSPEMSNITGTPSEFALHQNYPNPFNPTTKICFDLPVDSKVNLVVYDMLGREMKRLVNNEFKAAGRYEYEFSGESIPSGVYFYSLYVDGKPQSGRQIGVKRMTLVK